jgi:diguanylate cyclase (GGDEF)-like protein
MNEKGMNQKKSSLDIIAVIIYAVIYFLVSLLQSKLSASPGSSGNVIMGICSQLLTLFSAFVVVAFPRFGYYVAVAMNLFTVGKLAIGIKRAGITTAFTGLITSLSAIILITIIYVFYRKVIKNNYELTKANNELHEKEKTLTYLAYNDILTGLPNRQSFIEKIDEAINRTAPFTVIAANIDNFKNINNELGNNAGDAVLCSYSKKLKKICGETIFLARINGDEFGFILFGNESEATILNYVDTIKEVISEPIQINDIKLNITMSYGITLYPQHATDSTEMLKCVSSALSVSKANGKNTHYFYNKNIVL